MLLIKNLQIYNGKDEILQNGDILIENKKIKNIGKDIICDEAEVLDGKGMYALPGIIDCHTHIGLMNVINRTTKGDISETTNPVTPTVDVIYGTDITVKDFRHAYENGITTVGIIPGSSNVINGIGFATKTYGNNIFDMCIKRPIGFKVALGENPKGLYDAKNMEPASRMGASFLFREYIADAKAYMLQKEEAQKNNQEFEINENMEAAIPLFKKEIPARIHCTHNDMATAIDIAKEFDFNFAIEHAWGADDYIDEIVESGCSIVYGPIGGKRTFYESRRTDIETVNELDKRGVNVALTTDCPILSLRSIMNMMEETVRTGTPVYRALKMITINAAKILGVDDRTGSLEIGKDADIALFNGLPGRDMAADIQCTVLNGEVVYQKNI